MSLPTTNWDQIGGNKPAKTLMHADVAQGNGERSEGSGEYMAVAEDVSKLYTGGDMREVGALRNINLHVKRGEFVAIVGPSGSGKSTLLNLLGAIDKPTEGKLIVDGIDISSLRGDPLADFRRGTIGMVFQLFNLVPVLSALENVKLPLIPYPPRGFNLDRRARSLLSEVGLAQRVGHMPSQLSGGEQQRVAVARALINEPQLILADEPTGNLDTKAGGELIDLFCRLHEQQGVSIVLVTHDHRVAERAQRVVELQDGKVIP